jgi:orotidine-5'-phosphate decarboxylase
MTRQQLVHQIFAKRSFLCVGLDTDPALIPAHLQHLPDPVFEFNKAIIDATQQYAVAYKPNIAFYEALGPAGWLSLQKTMDYIPKHIFTIADAKRGDIGNTSKLYAKTFFEPQAAGFNFDSVTVAPYMGADSVTPFLSYPNKWVILLALTSNQGSADFQLIENQSQTPLYQQVLQRSQAWGNSHNMMYVVGATQANMLATIRQTIPDHFLLVPGVGAQGGSLEQVAQYGINKDCGLLVNASRSIIYASTSADFATAAAAEAASIQAQMQTILANL